MRLFTLSTYRMMVFLVIGVSYISGCSGSSANQDLSREDDGALTDITGDGEVVTVVPDPLSQVSTSVTFDVTVPAYVSNSLQVRIVWGDIDITAGWVGDEIWSASAELPTNTENLLVVTFYDELYRSQLISLILIGGIATMMGTATLKS